MHAEHVFFGKSEPWVTARQCEFQEEQNKLSGGQNRPRSIRENPPKRAKCPALAKLIALQKSALLTQKLARA